MDAQMETNVPTHVSDMVPLMRRAHRRILQALQDRGLRVEDYPQITGGGNPRGVAAARAYPIQGILKYHGIADWHWRTAYLPSISVNNDAAYSLTLVQFDPALDDDVVSIGSEIVLGHQRDRVQRTLDAVRAIGHIDSCARVASRNVIRSAATGKGLGTSASASAALAAASLAAALGSQAVTNRRLLSCTSRLLAGSGCRSAVGGVSLWLSYPGISHSESYAVRLDRKEELKDLALITVPLASRTGLETESAHHDAPHSIFFKPWMRSRTDEILECIQAVVDGDWRTVGQLAELDSIRLHGITMSASRENKIFAWEPENIPLFRMCNELRSGGVPVYFSTDTGPTTVFLTHRDHADAVVGAIDSLRMGFRVIRGGVAGPAELVDVDRAARELGA